MIQIQLGMTLYVKQTIAGYTERVTHLLQKVSIVFMFPSFPDTHMCVCSFAPTNASSLGGPQTKKRTLSRKLREARLWLITHIHVVVCKLLHRYQPRF